MKVLELFSGRHKSFATQAELLGHDVLTIDIDANNNPDIVADIGSLTLLDIPIHWRKPQIVWASPPCTTFSIASVSTHWKIDREQSRTPRTKLASDHHLLICHLMGLLYQLHPVYWCIENPRGSLRKLYPLTDVNKHTVTYCQYGDHRMKPTDIWVNPNLYKIWIPRPMCKNGDPCHVRAPRGSQTGTQNPNEDSLDRARVPAELCIEIIQTVETLGPRGAGIDF